MMMMIMISIHHLQTPALLVFMKDVYVMDIFVAVLSLAQVADLQAAAIVVSLPAASQHVGFTATNSQLGSSRYPAYFFHRNVSDGYTHVFDKELDRVLKWQTTW